MSWPVSGVPLVGRERQLASALAALSVPNAPGLLIAGPAGLGKTRLAKEIADRLPGREVLAVRCPAVGPKLALSALAGLLPVDDRHDPSLSPFQRGLIGLRRLVGQTHPVLSIDDAHRLDETSAAVVHQAVAEGLVTVLATVRTDEPTPEAVTALWKEAAMVRAELAPLNDSEARALLIAALGGPVEGQTLRRLVGAAGGNPLFLRELVTSAAEAGLLDHEGGLWRLTGPMTAAPRLTGLLQSRLAASDPGERDALELLAVGEPLVLSVAEAVIDARVLEALERRGLVTVETSDRQTVKLSHPLYAELLRSGTPALGRRRHVRLLADAMESAAEPGGEDLMRIALWRLDGGGPVNLKLTMAAAERAALIREFALSERLALRAYEVGGRVGAGLAAVRAMVQLGRVDKATELCSQLATRAAQGADLVQVVIQHAEIMVHARDNVHAALSLLDKAAESVADPRWHRQLAVYRLYLRAYQLDSTVLDDALAAFHSAGPVEARLAASAAAGCAMLVAGRFAEAEAFVAQAVPLTVQHTGSSQMQSGGVGPTAALLRCYRSDPAAAHEIAYSGYLASLQPVHRVGQALHALTLAQIALFTGRPRTASRWAREAHLVAGEVEMRPLHRWASAVELQANVQSGTAADRTDLDRYPSGPQSLHLFDIEVARALAWWGSANSDGGSGLSALADAVGRHGRLGAVGTATLGVIDLIRLGAAGPATELLAAHPPDPSWPLGATVVSYAAAAHEGDPEALLAVAAQFAGHGMRLHAAEAATQAGAVWSASRESRAMARAYLFADTQLTQIGEPVSTPVLRRRGPVTRLTRREHDVVLAAARGEQSRVIAARLHLSERTVENHLHRAYSKLGVTGRAELRGVLGLN